MLAEIRVGHHQREEVVVGARDVDGEADRNRGGDGFLLDDEQFVAVRRVGRRDRRARSRSRRQGIEDLLPHPVDEPVGIAAAEADERPVARVVRRMERADVVEGE